MPFSFTLANDEGQYTFNFPKVQVAGDWPDGGNTDIIQVQLDITAADESPTITRAATIPATGITVTPETASVDVGDTTSLTATLAPVGATDTVTWESSDPEVATVSASGVVTGVAAGTATITAKVRTFTDTATITVTEP